MAAGLVDLLWSSAHDSIDDVGSCARRVIVDGVPGRVFLEKRGDAVWGRRHIPDDR